MRSGLVSGRATGYENGCCHVPSPWSSAISTMRMYLQCINQDRKTPTRHMQCEACSAGLREKLSITMHARTGYTTCVPASGRQAQGGSLANNYKGERPEDQAGKPLQHSTPSGNPPSSAA